MLTLEEYEQLNPRCELTHNGAPVVYATPQEIRNNIPAKEVFSTLNALGRVGKGYSESRLVLPLTPGDFGAVAEPARNFWSGCADWILGGDFGARRDPLLYDIKVEPPPELAQPARSPTQTGAPPRFSF
jgi:hypothetical protein